MFPISILNEVCYCDVFISAFVHIKTQDDKTLLDTYFARCIQFLSHFMNTWKWNKITQITTTRGLRFALVWNGGICNVMVQVVKNSDLILKGNQNKIDGQWDVNIGKNIIKVITPTTGQLVINTMIRRDQA